MTKRTFIFAATLLLGIASAAIMASAQIPDLFRNDPAQYFKGQKSMTWVGTGVYFQSNYADTLRFAADSSGRGLTISRVLVNADKGQAISRGRGFLSPEAGDSTYALLWSERGYPDVKGRMRWHEGQWVIGFQGEWDQWSIRVRQDDPGALVAAAARMIPGFRPVELTSMTYRVVSN